jgi:hypothetical protein
MQDKHNINEMTYIIKFMCILLKRVFVFCIVLSNYNFYFFKGETPYDGMSSRIVPEKIQNGYRLKRPELMAILFMK